MRMTQEEMKAAVLAECERLCKDGAQPKFYWGSIWMRDGMPMFSLTIPSIASVSAYVHRAPSVTIDILYSLLGLETRDAVEAEREISDEYLLRLKYERAKSAKLVEALEVIRISMEQSGWDTVARSIYSDLCAAIEAYKEGATND